MADRHEKIAKLTGVEDSFTQEADKYVQVMIPSVGNSGSNRNAVQPVRAWIGAGISQLVEVNVRIHDCTVIQLPGRETGARKFRTTS